MEMHFWVGVDSVGMGAVVWYSMHGCAHILVPHVQHCRRSICTLATQPFSSVMILADVDWLGFDLDHTLVKYKNDALGEHIFRACSRYLWENHGYQKEVLENEVYDPAFNVRGKMWDLSTGDILELNQTGVVTAGWHGKMRLSQAELEERYSTTKPHVHFKKIKQFGRGDFFCFNDFFVSPTTQLVACLVHAVDSENEEPSGKEVYSAILSDLFCAFNGNFCPEHFQTGSGYYFQPLRDNISKYVFDRREDQTRAWLEKIRKAPFNKKLFLLTNSNFDYSELLLNAAYGDDWRDLFDIIIYRGAKKRGFFDQDHAEKPFLSYTRGSSIDGPPVETTLAEYVRGQQKELISGNLGELTAFLGQDARVVYFGDDVVGDIHYAKTKSSWRAVGIAEELGDENRKVPFTTCSDQSSSLLHTAYQEAGDQVLAECRHFGSA